MKAAPATQAQMVKCPQCNGQDEHCMFCDGRAIVTLTAATEWQRQNPEAI